MASTRTGLTMTEKAAKVQRKTLKTFRKPDNLLLRNTFTNNTGKSGSL